MPHFISPKPFLRIVLESQTEIRDPKTGTMTIVTDPDKPESGVVCKFQDGRFFLPRTGKYQGMRIVDVLGALVGPLGTNEQKDKYRKPHPLFGSDFFVDPNDPDGYWTEHGFVKEYVPAPQKVPTKKAFGEEIAEDAGELLKKKEAADRAAMKSATLEESQKVEA